MKNSRYSIFLLFLLFHLSGFTQTDDFEIDSLIKKANVFGTKNQDSAIYYSKLAYNSAFKKQDTFLIASTGYYYSFYLITNKRMNEAQSLLDFNIKHKEKLPNVLTGNTFYNQAAIYDLKEEFDDALEWYFAGKEYYE